ncbi:MAG: asparagine synthase (glutamine-hydrolyzing), partial [Candidatus Thorarchaeota archaeon]
LGHKRLSIIDPIGGKQPLSNEDGTIWIVFNGVIYNYLELRAELITKGHKFKTYSDTEVIIHSYEEWGQECLQKFNGMFAFVIWDSKNKLLWGARDRLGIKPLYYFFNGQTFIFASEIKAILASGLIKPEINLCGLKDYWTFQFCLGDKTLFKDIYKILPGYQFTIKQNGSNLDFLSKEYWDINFDYIDFEHHEEYFSDKLLLLLEDAIKIRLRSDVPLGAHLSGGLDSSSIVCIISSLLGNSSIKTFTGRFNEGPAFDESHYAKLVANKLGTDYHEITLTADNFKDTIETIIYYMDEPAAGPGVFPQFFVSKLASEKVKVVLGGQGGDEIFIGYVRYLIGYLEECLKGAIDETAKSGTYVVTLQTIIPNLNSLRNYKDFLSYFWKEGLFDSQEKRYFRLIDRSEGMKDLISPDILNESVYSPFQEFSNIFLKYKNTSLINKMTYFDIKASLPALLHVEDRTSMANSLESRVPFLDHRIVQLMATIPPIIKFKNGEMKYLLKKAVKNFVPKEILNRKDKMGFPVPLNKWFRKELKNFILDVLTDRKTIERGIFKRRAIEDILNKQTKFGRVIWGILCLELWFRKFID